MTTDSEMETEEEEREEEEDSWMPMVEEAMQKHKTAFEEMKMNYIESGIDRQSADQKAYSDILFKLQKELASIYLHRLQWIQQLKKDPAHKRMMQTKNALVNDDDFDPEEAIWKQLSIRENF